MTWRRQFRAARRTAVWLSLVVCVSVPLLAAVQHYRPDAVGFIHRDYDVPARTLRTVHLTAFEGGLWFDWAYHPIPAPDAHMKWSNSMRDHPHWWDRFGAPGGYAADETWLGFYGYLGRNANTTRYFIARLPYWFIAAASALLPALRLRRLLRTRKRLRQGLCTHCGYDLRGSSDRCPECGVASFARLAPGGYMSCLRDPAANPTDAGRRARATQDEVP
jgi:hypothetical protein